MFLNDSFDILRSNMAVPDAFWVHHDSGPCGASAETPGLVRSDVRLEPKLVKSSLQDF
jgi:hypothetical protein